MRPAALGCDAKPICVWPATRWTIAGPPPLYGTCRSSVLVIDETAHRQGVLRRPCPTCHKPARSASSARGRSTPPPMSRHRRMNHRHVAARHGRRDRREVPQRFVSELRKEEHVRAQIAHRAEHDGVTLVAATFAVGLGGRATRSRPSRVVDKHGLAQSVRQLRRDDPAHRVDTAARRLRRDDTDRLRRIGRLLGGDGRNERQDQRREAEAGVAAVTTDKKGRLSSSRS